MFTPLKQFKQIIFKLNTTHSAVPITISYTATQINVFLHNYSLANIKHKASAL